MYKPFFLQRLLASASSRPGMPSRAAVRSARGVASICHDLLSQRGEVSGALIAREALNAYKSLEGQALEAFFSFLVKEFSLDPEAVGRFADAYSKDPSPGNLVRLQRRWNRRARSSSGASTWPPAESACCWRCVAGCCRAWRSIRIGRVSKPISPTCSAP